jgi:hypothetical protein
MNIMRFTVIDSGGTVSFVGPCSALVPLVAACAKNPSSLEALLEAVEPYHAALRDYVLSGVAVFDEHNAPGNYESIHAAIRYFPSSEWPVFRVVDDTTRQASLQPVKAGAILFNLRRKRIVQLQNSFAEIGRTGHVRIYDGDRPTNRVRRYRLPEEWSLVP